MHKKILMLLIFSIFLVLPVSAIQTNVSVNYGNNGTDIIPILLTSDGKQLWDVQGNLTLENLVVNNNVTIGGWFNGLFNWVVTSNYATFDGATLVIDDALLNTNFNQTGDINSLNTTIQNINSSQWITNGLNISYSLGNVGIGTSSPDELLEVSGASGLDGATPVTTQIFSTNSGTWTNESIFSQIIFGNADTTGAGSGGPKAKIAGYVDDTTGKDSGMSFYTSTDGTSIVEQMRINHDGFVGIGTTDPNSVLTLGDGSSRVGLEVGDEDGYFVIKGTDEVRLIMEVTSGMANPFKLETGDTHFQMIPFSLFDMYWFEDSVDGDNRELRIYGRPTGSGGLNYGKLQMIGTDNDFEISTNLAGSDIILSPASNVGIGTSSPTTNLEVNDQIKIAGSFPEFNMNRSGGTGRSYLRVDANAPVLSFFDVGDGSENVRIVGYDSGNSWMMSDLGIGTSDPEQKLHVNVEDAGTNDIIEIMTVGRTSSGTVADGFGLDFLFRLEDNLGVNRNAGEIEVAWTDVSADEAYMAFELRSGGDPDEVMRLMGDSGFVGIGASNPTYTLDVVGNISMDEYLIRNGDSNTYLRFTADDVRMFAGGDQIFRADEDASPTLTFGTVWDTVFNSPALFIGGTQGSYSGNVGIGTTTPSTLLHIAKSLNPSAVAVTIDMPDSSTSISGIQAGIEIRNTDATDDNRVKINFEGSGGSPGAAMGAQFTDTSANEGEIWFATRASGGGVNERLRITHDGYLTGGSCAVGKTGMFWAEESGALSTGTGSGLQFSFGNGDIAGWGTVQPCAGDVVWFGMSCETGSSTTGKVQIAVDGVAQGTGCQVSGVSSDNGVSVDTSCSISFTANQQVTAITTTADAAVSGCVPTWYVQYD